MNKAFKFRIYPSAEQIVLIQKTFGCVRFIYNKMLAERIFRYESGDIDVSMQPAKYKPIYEWLREVDKFALDNARINLDSAYKKFFKEKKGFPRFKSKHRDKRTYTTNFTNNNIELLNGFIKLPKLGKIKIKQHRQIPCGYKLKSVTVSQTATGKYFVSVLYEYEQITEPKAVHSAVGLDFAMNGLFVSSSGECADYPRYYRRMQAKLAKEQRKLSKQLKGGKNRNKQRVKVARIHEKVANQRKDFLHKRSRQIANAYDCVCVEDLNMQAMSQCLNFGKSVSDNGWGMFVNMLSYKLAEQGKQLVKIGRWFPSSKTCSSCGAVKSELTLSERIYRCGCGFVADRDVNAAVNIKNEGLRLIA